MNIVYVSCKDKSEAINIAKSLVEEKLAVCINIIPQVLSVYRWKGKVEEAEESVLVIKTKSDLLNMIIKRIEELHSYENSVIVSWKIDKTTKNVERWFNVEL